MIFRNEYAFLSNFYLTPIHYNNLTFPSVENAFQYAKLPEDILTTSLGKTYVDQFTTCTPNQAKKLGRKIPIRSDWDTITKESEGLPFRVFIMRTLLRKKFQNNELREKLMQTNNIHLVETNYWHDNFWGDCICEKHKNTPGQNILGKLLESIRDELCHIKS